MKAPPTGVSLITGLLSKNVHYYAVCRLMCEREICEMIEESSDVQKSTDRKRVAASVLMLKGPF